MTASSSSQQLAVEIDQLTRRLRMPYLRKAAAEVLPTAKAQRWDPAEVVRVLLTEEADGRDAATIANRRRRAGFPTGKTFESWQPAASSIPPPTLQALRTLEWIRRAENLAVVGPSGTGKSHCESRSTGPTRVGTRLRTGGHGMTRSHTGSPAGAALGNGYVCPAAGAGPVHQRVA